MQGWPASALTEIVLVKSSLLEREGFRVIRLVYDSNTLLLL